MENEVKKTWDGMATEREFNIKDLFWAWVIRYKSIVVWMLVFAVLLAGYSIYSRARSAKQETTNAESGFINEEARAQEKVDNLREQIEIMERYRENSLMLRVNPEHVYKAELVYYVTNNYQINPNSYYQNPNNIGSILEYYNGIISRLDIDQSISSEQEPNLTVRNPVPKSTLKMISTSVNTSGGFISITVYGDTQEHLEMITEVYQNAIANSYSSVCEVVGEHEVAQVVFKQNVESNNDFSNFKLEFDKYLDTLHSDLKTAENALSSYTSTLGLTKSIVLGLALGVFASFLWTVLTIMLSDRVTSVENIQRRYQKAVMGTLSASNKNNKLDLLIINNLGLSVQKSETAGKYIATNVQARTKGKEITFINVDDSYALDSIESSVKPEMDKTEVTVCDNPNQSAAAIKVLQDKNPVVLVVRVLSTKHKDIYNLIKTCEAFGNDIIGFVVLY